MIRLLGKELLLFSDARNGIIHNRHNLLGVWLDLFRETQIFLIGKLLDDTINQGIFAYFPGIFNVVDALKHNGNIRKQLLTAVHGESERGVISHDHGIIPAGAVLFDLNSLPGHPLRRLRVKHLGIHELHIQCHLRVQCGLDAFNLERHR